MVLERLGLFPNKLELEGADCERTSRVFVWDDSMVEETSMTESTSMSLAAEREEVGLWGAGRPRRGINTPPSPPSSSMCSSRAAGEGRGGEAGGLDRLKEKEGTGVTEDDTGE